MRAHMSHVHDIDQQTEKYGEEDIRQNFECTDCRATFLYEKNLRAHMKSKHSKETDMYNCKSCGEILENLCMYFWDIQPILFG